MANLFEFPPKPEGWTSLRYDGVVAGAYGQLMCADCPRQLYAGACPFPAFLPEEKAKSGTQPQREE